MIRIGTAGFSYPTGAGKWTGVFYPKGVDPLSFYAHFFDMVEINNTFYRPPDASVTRAWVSKTPDDFLFAVKLFQKFTHPKMFEEATGEAAAVIAADYEEFDRGIEPLAAAGKLGPLLAQFPASFKRDDASIHHLEKLLDRFSRRQVVVELRHRSWTEDDSVAKLLAAHEASWVHIDEPKFRTRIRDVPEVGPVGYFRFHGRNAKDWWRGDRETRYNYLYSPGEMADLTQDVVAVADAARSTHVAFNNHYRAKAVANALEMRVLLGQEVPDDIPEPLLAEYPDLARLIKSEASER